MGQSVLKIHKVGDERYCPYGFYAETDSDGFQRPFSDRETLQRFQSDFRLQRTRQPGLSIVVPFPDEAEIRWDQMVRSAIIHYFYPILRGELIVEVLSESHSVKIDADSIDDIAASQVDWKDSPSTPDQLRNLFSLVRRTISLKPSELLLLPEPTPARAPDWNVGRFAPATISAIKKQFADKQLLAIRVPVTVRPKKADDRPTYFDAFIEQDPLITKPEDHYIRQGITIFENIFSPRNGLSRHRCRVRPSVIHLAGRFGEPVAYRVVRESDKAEGTV